MGNSEKKKKSGKNIIYLGEIISENNDLTYNKLFQAKTLDQDVHIFYCRTNEFKEVLFALNCFGKVQKLTKDKVDFLAYNELGAPEEHVLLLKYIENISVQRTVYQALKAISKAKTPQELDLIYDSFMEFCDNNIFLEKYKLKRQELDQKFR